MCVRLFTCRTTSRSCVGGRWHQPSPTATARGDPLRTLQHPVAVLVVGGISRHLRPLREATLCVRCTGPDTGGALWPGPPREPPPGRPGGPAGRSARPVCRTSRPVAKQRNGRSCVRAHLPARAPGAANLGRGARPGPGGPALARLSLAGRGGLSAPRERLAEATLGLRGQPPGPVAGRAARLVAALEPAAMAPPVRGPAPPVGPASGRPRTSRLCCRAVGVVRWPSGRPSAPRVMDYS